MRSLIESYELKIKELEKQLLNQGLQADSDKNARLSEEVRFLNI